MQRWVEITFDCLPLRTVGRLDIPLDASPKYRALLERIQSAMEAHGFHNTYYLYNARCIYHLANSDTIGMLQFRFDGTVMTGAEDLRTDRCELQVDLERETCHWLTEPIVRWFQETVSHAVAAEFDRFIEAGDLEKAKQRIEQIQSASDDAEGFLGMYL
ncbi:MAG: hypothetical protein ACC628_13445 [Pirellulaceae bacterium]